jgi:hypothetical protein
MEPKIPNENEIRNLEELLLKPETRKSEDVLSRVLAKDFLEIASSGRKYNKQQIIDALLNEKPEPLSLTDFQTRPLAPGLVLATYRAIRKGDSGQNSSSQRSSIWKYDDERWQIIFHQGTLESPL